MKTRILLLPSLLIALLLVLCAGACGGTEDDDSAPASRVKSHYAYVEAGEYGEAYAMLSTGQREDLFPTLEDFIAVVESGRYPVFHDLNVRETTFDSDEKAVVSWQAGSTRNNKEVLMDGDVLLVREGDTWMIDSFFATVAP